MDAPGNKRKLPPLEERDWFTEDETAIEIGAGLSTLRGWRREDQKRERKGLSCLDKAPRFRKTARICYPKKWVEAWKKRHSSRPDDNE
jgi:hypothetical protein